MLLCNPIDTSTRVPYVCTQISQSNQSPPFGGNLHFHDLISEVSSTASSPPFCIGLLNMLAVVDFPENVLLSPNLFFFKADMETLLFTTFFVFTFLSPFIIRFILGRMINITAMVHTMNVPTDCNIIKEE